MARSEFGEELDNLTYKTLKNSDFREVTLEREGKVLLKFAIANGFRNIQNLVQKLKRKRCDYDFVEILACPSGCLNGGAHLRPEEVREPRFYSNNNDVISRNPRPNNSSRH